MSIVDDFAAINQALRSVRAGSDNPGPVCIACEDGGWIMYGLGVGDPHFRECDVCYNPEGHPSP